MHDGGIETINDVIDFFYNGGCKNPQKDTLIKRINYSEKDKLDIIEFLYTLTDTTISKNINFIENNKFENSKLDY
jgi:cytochrome c peroxidase